MLLTWSLENRGVPATPMWATAQEALAKRDSCVIGICFVFPRERGKKRGETQKKNENENEKNQ